jgi:predicted nucleotidyltransferase component of viral defense system
MFKSAIDERTKRVLEKIKETTVGDNFYLAGGTALAIQLGHRMSIDLDWFCQEGFNGQNIKFELAKIGKFSISSEEEGTIHGQLDGVKITFLRYRYGQLYPIINFEGVNLADERDIAAMKIDAVSSRGSKKDFIDLYFLLEKYSLAELVGFFEHKFSDISYNKLHILKSLTYFEEAEDEPMPVMLKDMAWRDVKELMEKKVMEYMENLQKTA